MSTVLVVASAVWAAAKRWIDVISISLALASQIAASFLFVLEDQRALLVGQLLVEPLEQPALGFFGAQAAELMQRLPLEVEQVVELLLAAVGVFELLGQLALVVLDHLLLLLKLVGRAASSRSCCLSRCRSRSNVFCRAFVELLFDAGFFAEGQFLGFDFGFLVAGGGLDFGFFEDLPGFLFGVVLAQVAEQLDDAHSHDRGNQRDDDDQPRIGAGGVGYWAKQTIE